MSIRELWSQLTRGLVGPGKNLAFTLNEMRKKSLEGFEQSNIIGPKCFKGIILEAVWRRDWGPGRENRRRLLE